MKALYTALFCSLMALSSAALAHHPTTPDENILTPKAGDRSSNACSGAFCGYLFFVNDVNSSNEAEFDLQLDPSIAATDVKLDLFMDMGGGHGHGSAPVEMAALGNNKFKITNAWFVMMGVWQIRVDFNVQGVHQHFEVPVYVAE